MLCPVKDLTKRPIADAADVPWPSHHPRTGVPVLLNTSFNENEPIVHTPAHAIGCFQRTRMNGLAVGPFWYEKPADEAERGVAV